MTSPASRRAGTSSASPSTFLIDNAIRNRDTNALSYTDLSDEQKLEEAINFVATGQPLPTTLTEFLNEAGLYDLITRPKGVACLTSSAEQDSPQ